MLYNPSLLPYSDISIVILNIILIYLILHIEKINCLKNDWRSVYLKNYTVVNIIITTLSMLVSVNKWNLIVYTIFRLPLHIFLLYIVYIYARDLEVNLNNCKFNQSDTNSHEFLNFYSLLQACLILLIIAITLSILFSYFPIPKYCKK
jgi:hypothetical protein